ncbi:type II secretion system protein [Sulfurovum sp.]|uniref:type II secretion system protein n=1 Tax=Sulfurovum sp. TaxID=1969726 RepID=UPI003564B3A1
MKKAFTMVELVFVIVVIGILSAIAIPKLAATRDDAEETRAIATVGALRSAIATERQKSILRGVFTDINGSAAEDLLQYGLDSDWSRDGNVFTYVGPSGTTVLTLSRNKLDCTSGCSYLGL